jgi:hypothetical protein
MQHVRPPKIDACVIFQEGAAWPLIDVNLPVRRAAAGSSLRPASEDFTRRRGTRLIDFSR